MPANSKNGNRSTDKRASSTTYVNVALRRNTHTRLTAFKNYNPLIQRSFDEAINEALDTIDFPQAEEIENVHIPALPFPKQEAVDAEETARRS